VRRPQSWILGRAAVETILVAAPYIGHAFRYRVELQLLDRETLKASRIFKQFFSNDLYNMRSEAMRKGTAHARTAALEFRRDGLGPKATRRLQNKIVNLEEINAENREPQGQTRSRHVPREASARGTQSTASHGVEAHGGEEADIDV
jgi:hypothetical protein